MNGTRTLLLLAAAQLAHGAYSQSDEDWRSAAAGQLDEAAIEQLARDEVLVGPQRFKQVFEPYLVDPLPIFVTTDSLLGAYHVLFEESIAQLEELQAERLAPVLRSVRAGIGPAAVELELPRELGKKAEQRARTVLDVALALLGEEPRAGSLAALEKARIERATGTGTPPWLGPFDEDFTGIDYAGFAPRGFYERSELLRRYFRAVRWLQVVPFRVEIDAELAAMRLLGRALATSPDERAGDFWRTWKDLLGPGDTPGPDAACLGEPGEALGNARLAELRRRALELFAREEDEACSFHVLPAARTPDADILEEARERSQKRFPSGLDLCAALESQRMPERFAGGDLHTRYLRCLALLFDPPEEGAPAFMSCAPWRLKSRQTVLGAWALQRHAFRLQAKRISYYYGMLEKPVGLVEPVPEFYAALGAHVAAMHDFLERRGLFELDLLLKKYARDLLEFAESLRRGAERDEMRQNMFWCRLDDIGLIPELGDEEAMRLIFRGSDRDRRIARLEEIAEKAERGGLVLSPDSAESIRYYYQDLGERWTDMKTLCISLETLARKQLRGESFTQDDERFLLGYGMELAELMFYSENVPHPRDDAMKVVDLAVATDKQGRNPCYWHVGVARPRALWVLYPWNGKRLLLRGAVLAYREYVADSPLTDAQWKERLDKGAVAPPAWFKPIQASHVSGTK